MLIEEKLIEVAFQKLSQIFNPTILQENKRLSKMYGAKVFLKREDLQEVRSFKIRGAYNKISLLAKEQIKNGVVCASAGNHAQGVAYSCRALEIKGTIFMPETTPNQKVDRVRAFGEDWVDIVLIGKTFDEAYVASCNFMQSQEAIYIHPFDDELVIAGQATIATEILKQSHHHPDYILAAVGGGGLISGIISQVQAVDKNIKVIGAEPAGATSMQQSLKSNKLIELGAIDTFVDGAALKKVGEKTFDICKNYLHGIYGIAEGQVCSTMIELYQNEGIITEPAGALSVALLENIKTEIKGKTVVCVISGGNNDLSRYPEIVERSLIWQGLKHYFLIEFAQKPGQLRHFLDTVLGPNDDIVRFEYIKKTNKERGPALIGIQFQSRADLQSFLDNLNRAQIKYQDVMDNLLLYELLI